MDLRRPSASQYTSHDNGTTIVLCTHHVLVSGKRKIRDSERPHPTPSCAHPSSIILPHASPRTSARTSHHAAHGHATSTAHGHGQTSDATPTAHRVHDRASASLLAGSGSPAPPESSRNAEAGTGRRKSEPTRRPAAGTRPAGQTMNDIRSTSEHIIHMRGHPTNYTVFRPVCRSQHRQLTNMQ